MHSLDFLVPIPDLHFEMSNLFLEQVFSVFQPFDLFSQIFWSLIGFFERLLPLCKLGLLQLRIPLHVLFQLPQTKTPPQGLWELEILFLCQRNVHLRPQILVLVLGREVVQSALRGRKVDLSHEVVQLRLQGDVLFFYFYLFFLPRLVTFWASIPSVLKRTWNPFCRLLNSYIGFSIYYLFFINFFFQFI